MAGCCSRPRIGRGREGFNDDGYRIVINTNRDGGQTVFHLHVHLLAGRAMQGGFG